MKGTSRNRYTIIAKPTGFFAASETDWVLGLEAKERAILRTETIRMLFTEIAIIFVIVINKILYSMGILWYLYFL